MAYTIASPCLAASSVKTLAASTRITVQRSNASASLLASGGLKCQPAFSKASTREAGTAAVGRKVHVVLTSSGAAGTVPAGSGQQSKSEIGMTVEPDNGKNTLNTEWSLTSGGSGNGHVKASRLISANGHYEISMQDDGNLVVYQQLSSEHIPTWASQTSGRGAGCYAVMQGDGNLVVYNPGKKATWASDTYHKGTYPYRLVMQDDGNCVIYDSKDTATFSTRFQTGTVVKP